MTKYSESPVFWINLWIENRLRGIKELDGDPVAIDAIIPSIEEYGTDVDTNNSFNDDETFQAVPFFMPGGQVAEAMTIYDSSTGEFNHLPFATYGSFLQKVSDQPWLSSGQLSYSFYSVDTDKLFEIVNFIQDLTKREDWAAYDMNWFFRNNAAYPFEMKHLCFLNAAGPGPAKDEGGLSNYMVSIGWDCTYEGTGRVGEYGDETDRGMWV